LIIKPNPKFKCPFDATFPAYPIFFLGRHPHLKQTRCVIHNGHAINLISTIYIYDKLLVIGKGKIENNDDVF
jgi:hypothetical protein